MDIVLNIIFVILGFLVGCFGMAQILTAIRFAKPFIKELESVTTINSSIINKKLNKTILVWVFIILLCFLAVYYFILFRLIAFLIGFVIVTFAVYGHCGKTEQNITDFLSAYQNDIDLDFLTSFENPYNRQQEE